MQRKMYYKDTFVRKDIEMTMSSINRYISGEMGFCDGESNVIKIDVNESMTIT